VDDRSVQNRHIRGSPVRISQQSFSGAWSSRRLRGATEELKERMLGIAVFKRPAEYDTSADPVVRNTASEVRTPKRVLLKRRARQMNSEFVSRSGAMSRSVGTPSPKFAGSRRNRGLRPPCRMGAVGGYWCQLAYPRPWGSGFSELLNCLRAGRPSVSFGLRYCRRRTRCWSSRTCGSPFETSHNRIPAAPLSGHGLWSGHR
jgi:hypothetical protein